MRFPRIEHPRAPASLRRKEIFPERNPVCPGPAAARSSDPAPPSSLKTGAERSQNVTGPRRSAPKRGPPPGRPGRLRQVPPLPPSAPRRVHSFLKRTASPPTMTIPVHSKPTRRFVSSPAGNRGAHWSARPGATSSHLGARGASAPDNPSVSPGLGPRALLQPQARAHRRVLLGIRDQEMRIPVPPSAQLKPPPLLLRPLRNTRFFSPFRRPGPCPFGRARARVAPRPRSPGSPGRPGLRPRPLGRAGAVATRVLT